MTPAARVQAAIELCAAICDGESAADATIEGYFRHRRYAGAKDRRAISDQVYAVLRRRAHIDWWIARANPDLAGSDRGRARVIADMVVSASPGTAKVETLFSGGQHCPAPLSGEERVLVSALAEKDAPDNDMPDWVAGEYPDWLEAELHTAWGARTAEEADALNRTAPLDLRVNTLKASRDQARRALAQDSIAADETPISPLGLRITGRRTRIGGTQAFRDGLVEVQDEGSQIIALLTDARAGMTVIDFCAGAGGKTLALAASLGSQRDSGSITACDVSARRIDRLRVRLRRAGSPNVRSRLLKPERDPWLISQAGRFDRVLVDVPCTGTGTWRRHPDAKWRLKPADVRQNISRQRRVLSAAWRLVKPGGRLIYATCSLLPAENERQVEWLLARHGELVPVPIGEVWAETLPGPCPATGPWLRLSPAATGTDGFFVAVLRRRA